MNTKYAKAMQVLDHLKIYSNIYILPKRTAMLCRKYEKW